MARRKGEGKRRLVRARAAGVPSREAGGALRPVLISDRRVRIWGLDIVPEQPLRSVGHPSGASSAADRAEALRTVEEVCEVLADGEAYGEVLGYQAALEWQHWTSQGPVDAFMIESDWWGTTQHLHYQPTMAELTDALREVLEQGTNARNIFAYLEPGTAEAEWIEVPRLSLRWVTCKPKNPRAVACPPERGAKKRGRKKKT